MTYFSWTHHENLPFIYRLITADVSVLPVRLFDSSKMSNGDNIADVPLRKRCFESVSLNRDREPVDYDLINTCYLL